MSKKKSYCISANSKTSRSIDIANGKLGTRATIQLVGDNYIVVRGDISEPFIKDVIFENFHVFDDIDGEVECYEL